MSLDLNTPRAKLLFAVLGGPHSVTKNLIVLSFDRSKPGDSATSQLGTRLQAAWNGLQAQPEAQEPDPQEPLAGHITVRHYGADGTETVSEWPRPAAPTDKQSLQVAEAVAVVQREQAQELAEWRKLRDPAVLHLSLLRGIPAQLTDMQYRHLIGETATGEFATKVASLPERDARLPNSAQGVYRKFEVRRTDGKDRPGEKHEGCEYFVLDVTHDQHAKAALTAYAAAADATHPTLAADMRDRYQLPVPTVSQLQGTGGDPERLAFEDNVRTHGAFEEEWLHRADFKDSVKFGQYVHWPMEQRWQGFQAGAAWARTPLGTPAPLTAEQIPRGSIDVSYADGWTAAQKLGHIASCLRWPACGYVNSPERIQALRVAWKLAENLSAALAEEPKP